MLDSYHNRQRGGTLDQLVNVITFPVNVMQEILFVVVSYSVENNTSTTHIYAHTHIIIIYVQVCMYAYICVYNTVHVFGVLVCRPNSRNVWL